MAKNRQKCKEDAFCLYIFRTCIFYPGAFPLTTKVTSIHAPNYKGVSAIRLGSFLCLCGHASRHAWQAPSFQPIFDQKVLSAKKCPTLIRHTNTRIQQRGSTSIKPGKNPAQKTNLSIIKSIKEKKQRKNRKERKYASEPVFQSCNDVG